jgi:hypothetical protein
MESRQVVATSLNQMADRLVGPLQLYVQTGGNPAHSLLSGSISRGQISSDYQGYAVEFARLRWTAREVGDVTGRPDLGKVGAVSENGVLVERAAYQRQQEVLGLIAAQDAQTLAVHAAGGLKLLESFGEGGLASTLWFVPDPTFLSKAAALYVLYRAADHFRIGGLQLLTGQQYDTDVARLARSGAKGLGYSDATAGKAAYYADLGADSVTVIAGMSLLMPRGTRLVGTAAPGTPPGRVDPKSLNIVGSTQKKLYDGDIAWMRQQLRDNEIQFWKDTVAADGKIRIIEINGRRFLANGNHRWHAAVAEGKTIPKWAIEIQVRPEFKGELTPFDQMIRVPGGRGD